MNTLKLIGREKELFTLMKMIEFNILNTEKTLKQSISKGVKKYFCVSNDNVDNPFNMKGTSTRIMEMYFMRQSQNVVISTARYVNVAFLEKRTDNIPSSFEF